MSVEPERFNQAVATAAKLSKGLSKVIRGRDDTIKLVVAALIADGHVLLEDYPGSGKTMLSKTLGRLIATEDNGRYPTRASDPVAPFRRIQFTPDMLPGDVLGVNVFDPKTAQFHFIHGPVFAHVVLADEINRTSPKVQAAFLECMAEKQVTIDNLTRPLDQLFFVIGTQNPLDFAGTYPLPLVQLDRFLLKIPMSYVDSKTETEILEQHSVIREASVASDPVCSRGDVLEARDICDNVFVSPELRSAIVSIVQATRGNNLVQYGASTRAALMLQKALQAHALVEGRQFATEDDLQYMAPFVMLHRLKFHPGAGEPRKALGDLIAPHMEKLIRGRARV